MLLLARPFIVMTSFVCGRFRHKCKFRVVLGSRLAGHRIWEKRRNTPAFQNCEYICHIYSEHVLPTAFGNLLRMRLRVVLRLFIWFLRNQVYLRTLQG